MNRTYASALALSLALSALTPTPGRADEDADLAQTELALKKLELEMQALQNQGQALANQSKASENAANKAKALLDAIPTSPTSGEIATEADAGKLEGQGLSAVTIKHLAALIAEDAGGAAGNVPVLLTSGAAPVTFAHYDQFRFQADALAYDLGKAVEKGEAVKTSASPKGAVEMKSALGAAGWASLAVKIAPLFMPDWEVGAVTVPADQDRSLALAIASAYGPSVSKPLHWQGAAGGRDGSREVFDTLKALHKQAEEIAELRGVIAERVKAAKTKAEKAALLAVDAELAEALEAYSTFTGSLRGADATLPIGAVIAEADAAKLLGSDGLVLNVKVESAAGGYVTRKALWNAFRPNFIPAYVSGGAVASYALVRPSDQFLLKSGVYACQTDYVPLQQVASKAYRVRKSPLKDAVEGQLVCKAS